MLSRDENEFKWHYIDATTKTRERLPPPCFGILVVIIF